MCGIYGYIGKKEKDVQNVLLSGLRKLEYRGYDSAGIAVGGKSGDFKIVKSKGKISNLSSEVEKKIGENEEFNFGISHTRWATHGEVSLENCHPHTDSKSDFVIVHNGIIENFSKLKKELEEKGYKFYGETDTEVVAKLLEENYNGNLLETVENVLPILEGAYAFLIMHKNHPGEMIGIKYGSPLLFGEKEGEMYFSSDVGAFGNGIENVVYLEDGDLVHIINNKIEEKYSIKSEGKLVNKPFEKIDIDLSIAEKGDFKHFMLKEIFEQPEILKRVFNGRINLETGDLFGDALMDLNKLNIKNITFIACGTSYHAGLLGSYWLENFAGIDVKVEVASEFIYKNINISDDRLFIFISQSGETADTIEALKIVKEKGGNTFGIVNVVGSTVSRMTDTGMFLRAGTEVGVASTKAFTAQCGIILLLSLYFGKKNLSHKKYLEIVLEIEKLPELLENILENFGKIKEEAKKMYNYTNFFFLGKHYQLPIAYETSLKLKEISYLHSEAYPAGELKHGPLALIDDKFISVVFAPEDGFLNQNVSALQEIKARKGKIVLISDSDEIEDFGADFTIKIGKTIPEFSPFLTTIVGQLLSYEIADLLGKDIDKPRNLAKSVTVK